LYAHDQIVIEELAGVLAVSANATHDGGQVNNDIRPYFSKYAAYVRFAPQIIVHFAGREYVPVPCAVQTRDRVSP
jgi:hypothetical protein